MLTTILKQLRKKAKLTQDQISEVIRVPKRTYGSWERGERQPDLATLMRIADYYHVSTDYLLGRTPMEVVVKHETPPPKGDDVVQLQFHLDDAPQDENSLERMIRNVIRQELRQELEKRGL